MRYHTDTHTGWGSDLDLDWSNLARNTMHIPWFLDSRLEKNNWGQLVKFKEGFHVNNIVSMLSFTNVIIICGYVRVCPSSKKTLKG